MPAGNLPDSRIVTRSPCRLPGRVQVHLPAALPLQRPPPDGRACAPAPARLHGVRQGAGAPGDQHQDSHAEAAGRQGGDLLSGVPSVYVCVGVVMYHAPGSKLQGCNPYAASVSGGQLLGRFYGALNFKGRFISPTPLHGVPYLGVLLL